MGSIDCRRCRHFYITWQKRFPYGCRAFAMNTKHVPSFHVALQSGAACLYYHEKKHNKRMEDLSFSQEVIPQQDHVFSLEKKTSIPPSLHDSDHLNQLG